MTMIADTAAPVTHIADGIEVHAALVAEARAAIGAALGASSSSPVEMAVVLDAATRSELDEVTLVALADVLAA